MKIIGATVALVVLVVLMVLTAGVLFLNRGESATLEINESQEQRFAAYARSNH
jgi:hypothetical protein